MPKNHTSMMHTPNTVSARRCQGVIVSSVRTLQCHPVHHSVRRQIPSFAEMRKTRWTSSKSRSDPCVTRAVILRVCAWPASFGR
jgi:hypothetical protein